MRDLLLRSSWNGARLEHLLRAAIEAYDTRGSEQFTIHPVNIEISPSAALPLVMTINELCTNALK